MADQAQERHQVAVWQIATTILQECAHGAPAAAATAASGPSDRYRATTRRATSGGAQPGGPPGAPSKPPLPGRRQQRGQRPSASSPRSVAADLAEPTARAKAAPAGAAGSASRVRPSKARSRGGGIMSRYSRPIGSGRAGSGQGGQVGPEGSPPVAEAAAVIRFAARKPWPPGSATASPGTALRPARPACG